MLLTVAAYLCLVASFVFVVIYANYRWYQTATGWSVMALACCLVALPAGTVLRESLGKSGLSDCVLAVAYVVTTGVMVWRTVAMWRVNHPHERNL